MESLRRPVDRSAILKRLMANTRVKEATRLKIANDARTEAFLDAGLRLLTGSHDERLEVRAGEASPRDYLWFSSRQVVEEANREYDGENAVTANMMNDRWPSRPDYEEDLIAYALTGGHGLSLFARGEEGGRLLREEEFSRAIQRVAYHHVVEMSESLGFRATLAFAVMARYDPAVTAADEEVYRLVTEEWSGLFAEVIRARGLELRPGISLREFTCMLTALADGFGLRMLADVNFRAEFVDHEKQESLLGKAIVALVASCFDSGDGMSHEEIVSLLDPADGSD